LRERKGIEGRHRGGFNALVQRGETSAKKRGVTSRRRMASESSGRERNQFDKIKKVSYVEVSWGSESEGKILRSGSF